MQSYSKTIYLLEHSNLLQSFCFISSVTPTSMNNLKSCSIQHCGDPASLRAPHPAEKSMWSRMCLEKGRSWSLTGTERVPRHQNRAPSGTPGTTGHSLGRLEHRSFPHPSPKNALHLFPADFHHAFVMQTKCYVYALNISQNTMKYNTSGSVLFI